MPKAKIALIISLIIIVLAGGSYYYWNKFYKQGSPTPITSPSQTPSIIGSPLENEQSHFGFLGGGEEELEIFKQLGVHWVRPHPGYALWDSIQPKENGPLNFKLMDQEVKNYQQAGMNLLITVWPFAEWDQNKYPEPRACEVTSIEQFRLPAKPTKDQEYLPAHRCPPNNMGQWLDFIGKLVERYDGDGQDDFKELNVPIKYWEISNEPEMQMPNLQFWFGDAKTYTPFLLATSKKIKEVCPSCQILPGGMANTSEQSKKFFKDVFADAGIGQAIDITNIHFISNGEDLASLNVKTFKSFIEQFKLLQKPLWVTEAETIIDSDPTKNEEQLIKSTLDALSLGTTKIFYTRQDFEKQANSAPFPPGQSGLPILKTKTTPPKKEVSKVYLTLINKLNYFDSVQKLAEGQYKFKVGSKTIYFIWKGTLPYELTGKISVTDLYGTEKTIDCATFQTSSKGEYIE